MKHLFLILVFFGLLSCNDQAQNDGANRRNSGDQETNTKKGAKTGTDTTVDDGDDDSSGSSNGEDEGDKVNTGSGTSGTCNFKFSDKLSSPVSAQGAAQAPIIGSINFNLKANASMTVTGSTTKATVGLDATITSFSPALARSLADNVINSYKDPLKLTIVPQNKLAAFYKNTPGWEDLDCIVIPVTKVSNSAYEYEFDPAIPMIIAPTLTEKDNAKVLDSAVTISNIKSKLIRHFQPESVAKRGEYEGSAKISNENGNFTIAYDFGSKAPEALATPMAGIAYQLSSTKGKFDAVTITSFVSDNSKIDLKITK